jgi:hypothetical protein
MSSRRALGFGCGLACLAGCQVTYIDVGSNRKVGASGTTASGTTGTSGSSSGSTSGSSGSSTTSTGGTGGGTTASTSGTGGAGGAVACTPGIDGGSQVWSYAYGPVPDSVFTGNPINIAVDSKGNVIVAGSFTGSIDLGCGALADAGASTSVFVAKLDPSGACLWSEGFSASQGIDGGGPPEAWAGGVAVDPSNNVILTGAASGSIAFGSNQLTGAFVVKLDPSGAPLWSTGLDVALGPGVAVDASGNVLLLGTFDGSIDIAGQHFTSPEPGTNVVVKLDSGGVPVWGKTFDALYNAVPSGGSIAVDASGNVLLTGFFEGGADFGCGAPLTESAFVAKLDPGGACAWNNGFAGATSASFGRGGAAAAGGQVVITGWFSGPGTIDFGNGPVAGMAEGNLFVATRGAPWRGPKPLASAGTSGGTRSPWTPPGTSSSSATCPAPSTSAAAR